MRLSNWVAVATLALTSVGCGGNEDLTEAEDNLALWLKKGPASYVYVVQTDCFCRSREAVRVVVEDDLVVSSIGTESGEDVPKSTMTELLRAVVRDAGDDNATFEAEYDSALGYLLHLEVDKKADWADDEFTTTVSCLEQGTSDELCR